MYFHPLRYKLVVLLVSALAASSLFAAPKRRAVPHPTSGTPVTATIKGTVVDAATGQPVAFVNLVAGTAGTQTNTQGAFQLSNIASNGTIAVSASRTGYETSSQNVNGGGTHTLTFSLTPKPTVSVRLTNGTTVQMDREELKFGYVVLFSGYAAFEHEDFCKADGTFVNYTTDQMKRIIGPATQVNQGNCCPRPIQKVRLELRTGETSDVFFKDSCNNETVDLVGRNHVTGAPTFIRFSEIAEVIFP